MNTLQKQSSCHGIFGRRAGAYPQVLLHQIDQDTSPRVHLDPESSITHPCHGLSGWGVNLHALPNQRSQGTDSRWQAWHIVKELLPRRMWWKAKTNHKSCPTTEAKAPAQGLTWWKCTGKGNLISKNHPLLSKLVRDGLRNKRHVA